MHTWKYNSSEDSNPNVTHRLMRLMFRALYITILNVVEELKRDGAGHDEPIVEVSPRVCAVLQTLPEYAFTEDKTMMLAGWITIDRNLEATEDCVIVKVGKKEDIIEVDLNC